jgi:hypothetical protein
MSLAQQLAEDWRRLRAAPGWQATPGAPFPELTPCQVRLESCFEADPDAVDRAAARFGARWGWLERQSRLALVDPGAWPAAEGGFDAILSGELAGEGESLLIRRVAEGWRLARIGDQPSPDGECLSHDQSMAGVDILPVAGVPFGARLNYRVYWRHDPDLGWRQFAARLLGFDWSVAEA